jgi:diguanylate cyclase (GGDEF)-like protein
VFDLIAPEYRSEYQNMHKRVIAGEKLQMEFEMLCLKGSRRIMSTNAVPMLDNGSVVHLAVTRDITDRKMLEKQLQHKAYYDVLTGLPNRVLFSDRIQQSFAAAKRDNKRFAVMFIDLDSFKPVNDDYGHGMGDLLLKEVADRIRTTVRESDTVARIGGDEFLVLLREVKEDQETTFVAEKVRIAISQPFLIAGQSFRISSSIGIAIFPEHGDNEIELCRNADIAMYQSKKNGRDAVKLFQLS